MKHKVSMIEALQFPSLFHKEDYKHQIMKSSKSSRHIPSNPKRLIEIVSDLFLNLCSLKNVTA